MTVFEQKVNSLLKFVKKVSPQIAISESTKSGREKLISLRFTQKTTSCSRRNKKQIK